MDFWDTPQAVISFRAFKKLVPAHREKMPDTKGTRMRRPLVRALAKHVAFVEGTK